MLSMMESRVPTRKIIRQGRYMEKKRKSRVEKSTKRAEGSQTSSGEGKSQAVSSKVNVNPL